MNRRELFTRTIMALAGLVGLKALHRSQPDQHVLDHQFLSQGQGACSVCLQSALVLAGLSAEPYAQRELTREFTFQWLKAQQHGSPRFSISSYSWNRDHSPWALLVDTENHVVRQLHRHVPGQG